MNYNMTDVLLLPPSPGNPRNSEGAFAQLSSGRLIYVYSRYSGDSWNDHAPADLALRYSDDQGRTWSNRDRIILSRGNAMNLMSVSLLRLASGRLLLFHCKKVLSPDGCVNCLLCVSVSDDEAETWSPSRYISSSEGYNVIHNDRAVRLSEGRIILPVSYHRHTSDREPDSHGFVIIFYSDDEGETFREVPGWILPPQHSNNGFQEPGVIELRDGRLMCWTRTDMGCQYLAYSSDKGMTWSEPCRSNFFSPLSPMSIKRNPVTGALVAVWNDLSPRWGFPPPRYVSPGWGEGSSGGRTPLVMAESFNEGKTWCHHLLLESDRELGFCYTAMFFVGNALLLAYCCGGENNTIMLQRSKIRLLEPLDESAIITGTTAAGKHRKPLSVG